MTDAKRTLGQSLFGPAENTLRPSIWNAMLGPHGMAASRNALPDVSTLRTGLARRIARERPPLTHQTSDGRREADGVAAFLYVFG